VTVVVRQGGAGFSACAEALLRKHGIVPVSGGLALSVIPAGTLSPGESPPAPCLIEGPVNPQTLASLGIAAEARTAPSLRLRCPVQGLLGPLAHTRWLLRPKDRAGVRGTPYPLELGPPWKTAIDYQRLDAGGPWRPALYASGPDDELDDVVAVSDGARLVLGVPLLEVLGSLMAWPAFADGYFAVDSPTVAPAVESWLIAALRDHALAAGSPWGQIEQWPEGAAWAVTIRHDYDRLLTDAELRALLGVYEQLGVRSTWYLLRNRTIGRQARLLAAQGHEVALHTTARSEQEFAEEVAALHTESGLDVQGVTAHGGDAIGYLGDRHIEWASGAGLRHGETIGRISTLPFLAHRVAPGGVEPTRQVMLATHRSLDGGMGPEQHHLAQILELTPRMADRGAHLVLMNHPDVHRPQLLQALAHAPLASAWRCTAADAARWTLGSKYGTSWHFGGDAGRLSLRLDAPLPWAVTATLNTPGGTTRMTTIPSFEVAAELTP
jgi:hypothetical protein